MTALRWLWLSAAIILADQVTKLAVLRAFELGESHHLAPILDFTYARNYGASWGFLDDAGGWQRWVLSGLALAVAGALGVWLSRVRVPERTLLAVGIALVIGGAIGNVIDRAAYGYVIDFISVHWNDSYFPAFNIADSAISVGAAGIIIDELRKERAGKDG